MARLGDMENRHNRILDILAVEPATSVARLSSLLGVTKETVRKDLSLLESQGKVSRIHGGAARIDRPQHLPFQLRATIDEEEKKRIAAAASQLVCEGEHIIIEASTTNFLLCNALLQQPEKLATVTIITNSLRIAQLLENGAKCGKLIFLGGEMDAEEGRTKGSQVVATLSAYQADKAFLSVAALNRDLKITAFKEEDMLFQKKMLSCACRTYALVNSRKYPTSALYTVCEAGVLTGLITDAKFEAEAKQYLAIQHTDVIVV